VKQKGFIEKLYAGRGERVKSFLARERGTVICSARLHSRTMSVAAIRGQGSGVRD
jgi:hypothetical protein